MEISIPVVIVAAIALLGLAIALLRTWQELSSLKKRFAPIVYLDDELEKLDKQRDKLTEEVGTQRDKWKSEFTETISELEALTAQLDDTRDQVELQSFGIYEPQFDFDTPDDYKNKIKAIRDEQKKLVRDKKAAVCLIEWKVEGSVAKGRTMTNRQLRLMLRAFNGECDAAGAKVRYNNVAALEKRMGRAFDAINKLGKSNHCEVVQRYSQLKLDELRCAHEYQEKRQEVKEEQRQIREQMREEERARREIEKAQQEAEKEEAGYDAALEKAREELTSASEAKQVALEEKIAALQVKLDEAHANKERAMSRAQLTKSGHVYVISNVGSFGGGTLKIGMTRRLDPMDRVKELGDASVPFGFDVHAMMYSEDAPALEKTLHKRFSGRRVNLVNTRKEFFVVDLDEVEAAATENDAEVAFTKAAEAEEYRRTLSILEENKAQDEPQPTLVEHARETLKRRMALWSSPGSDQDGDQKRQETKEAPA